MMMKRSVRKRNASGFRLRKNKRSARSKSENVLRRPSASKIVPGQRNARRQIKLKRRGLRGRYLKSSIRRSRRKGSLKWRSESRRSNSDKANSRSRKKREKKRHDGRPKRRNRGVKRRLD